MDTIHRRFGVIAAVVISLLTGCGQDFENLRRGSNDEGSDDNGYGIYNGTTAGLEPYQAVGLLLTVTKVSSTTQRIGTCTGTLIGPQVVLTAAHCVSGAPQSSPAYDTGALTDPKTMSFSLDGKTNFIAVTAVVRHPNYLPPGSEGLIGGADLAIVKLAARPLNNYQPGLALWSGAVQGGGIGVGFGKDELQQLGVKKLGRFLNLTPTSGVEINPATRQLVEKPNGQIIVDRDPTTEQMICGGDSGGPLFMHQLGIVGVTSWAYSDGYGTCGLSELGGYMSVSAYLSWIESTRTQLDQNLTTKLVLKAPVSASANTCSPILLGGLNAANTVSLGQIRAALSVSANPPGAAFYSDQSCTKALTSIAIGGVPTITVYFKANAAGTYTLAAKKAVGAPLDPGPAAQTASAVLTIVPTPPAAPSSLKAVATSNVQIDLSWTNNSVNETGFKIWRQTGTGAFVELATVAAGIKTYRNKSLLSSTTYGYMIQAFNTGGMSAMSNTATVKTLATGTPPPPAPTPPLAPSSLVAKVLSSYEIKLTWTDNSFGDSAFVVERQTGTGAYAVIGGVLRVSIPAGSTQVTLLNPVSSDTQYTYRVRAKNTAGYSAYATSATVKTFATNVLLAPEVTLTRLSATKIRVTFVNTSPAATGFNIERSNGGAYAAITVLSAGPVNGTLTFDDTITLPATGTLTYSYQARGKNVLGRGPISASVSITVP